MNSTLVSAFLVLALLGSAASAYTQQQPAAVILPPPPAAPPLPMTTPLPRSAGSVSPIGPVFIVEYSTDMPGSDLRPGFPARDLGRCMNACVEDPNCRAFTWVKPYEQPPRRDNASPFCWLKNSAPNKMMNPGMISGIKQ